MLLLNERKIKILEAIINDYIQTAEPIGSRTIAKRYDLGICSATIRNEMSDLEEMGFIVQPHASAGRIPSDKGYRLYVDKLMQERELTDEEAHLLQSVISDNIYQIDYLMQETAKALAMLTNYTTIVTEPRRNMSRIQNVQLMPLDEKSIVLVMITEEKVIRNAVINVKSVPDYDVLMNLSAKLNKSLKGKSTDHADASLIDELTIMFGEYSYLLSPIFNTILNFFQSEEDIHYYTSGIKNILSFPEFSDLEKARTFFKTLEEREMLITLMSDERPDNLQILIGSEHSFEVLRDCSLIKANYAIGDNSFGSIGIIGPTRMDYTQAVSVLNGIVKKINKAIKALSGG